MFSKHISKSANVNNKLIIMLNNVTLATRKTLDNLLGRANMHEVVYPAQTTIAKEVGTSRETVNRIISHLVELNLITKTTRLWNSCIYEINPELNDPELRWQLRHLFKAFKMRPLVPLLLIPTAIISDIKENNSFHKHMSHHISSSFPSSSPNSYLYNYSNTTNVSTTTVEEKTWNVEHYMDRVQEINQFLKRQNSYNLKKDVVMLQKVKERLNLGDYETSQLSEFDDVVLGDSLKIFEKSKGISNPFRYFLGTCNKLKEKYKNKPQTQQREIKKPTAWVNTEAVAPERTVEFLELEIEKIKAHDLPAIMTGEGMLFHGLKEKLLTNLEAELLKIKQESTITIEVVQDQPKTQEIKKDSTTVKFDHKSAYEEKYKNHEQADQIKAWLQTVVVDDGNYEEVYD